MSVKRSQNQAFEEDCFNHLSRLLGSPAPRLFGALVAGYFLSFESPSSLNTALALRQAIWRKEDVTTKQFILGDVTDSECRRTVL